MTIDQIAISLIVLITFALFVYGKWRYDIVAVLSLVMLVISDKLIGSDQSALIIDINKIFLGFGHPAVVTVAAVLIISTAMKNSGVVDFLSRRIKPYISKQSAHISGLSFLIAILSGFMNNVGALALMLPVTLKTAWEKKRSPSLLLMPLAFASILGGMITMIGTPPNIIISNVRLEQQELILKKALEDPNSMHAHYLNKQMIEMDTFQPTSFGLFDFTPVGGIIALLGVIFISLFGWRLIPKNRKEKADGKSLFKIDDYITEIRIPDDSKLIGLSVKEINKLTNDRLTLFKLIDKDDIKFLSPDYIICENNLFLAMADPLDLKEIMDEFKVRFTKEMRYRIDSLKQNDTTLIEVVITPDSSLVGKMRKYFRRRTSNRMTLMAIARQNKPIHKRLGKVIFQIGDVLLLQGSEQELKNNINHLDLLPLARRELELGIFSKVGYALSIFIVAILLSMLGIFPTTVSFIGAILVYIFSGLLKPKDLYKSIDWPIIILLASMIPISDALQNTGTTSLISNCLVNLTSGLPPWVIISLLMIITMCLSDVINNAATALIMAPISVGIAIEMGLSIDPFLMAVAIGASCAFLTPIGHQCNALILGPGGYKFGDYWRLGLPLEIIIVILGTPLILYYWPL